jgi:hypothetical protein
MLAFLFSAGILSPGVFAQNDHIRPQAFGISFMLNDFITPQRIRSTSLSQVLDNQDWAKLSDMGSGLAIHYFKGVRNHIDFATTISGSFIHEVADGNTESESTFLLEADASANFKMLSDKHAVTPYLIAGTGVCLLRHSWGAFIPLGIGVKFNLFNEAAIFLNSQYRIPVTTFSIDYHFVYSLGIAGVIGGKKNEISPAIEY